MLKYAGPNYSTASRVSCCFCIVTGYCSHVPHTNHLETIVALTCWFDQLQSPGSSYTFLEILFLLKHSTRGMSKYIYIQYIPLLYYIEPNKRQCRYKYAVHEVSRIFGFHLSTCRCHPSPFAVHSLLFALQKNCSAANPRV